MKEDRFKFYQDRRKEWRWKRYAPNNRTVGSSSEGYKNKSDCIDNAKRVGGFNENVHKHNLN